MQGNPVQFFEIKNNSINNRQEPNMLYLII